MVFPDKSTDLCPKKRKKKAQDIKDKDQRIFTKKKKKKYTETYFFV